MEQVCVSGQAANDVMIDALECLLEKRRSERDAADRDVREIQRNLRQVRLGQDYEVVPNRKYAGWLDFVRPWAQTLGRGFTTREAVDAALTAGVETTSKKPVATLHATLRNATDFRRNGNKWDLVTPRPSGYVQS